VRPRSQFGAFLICRFAVAVLGVGAAAHAAEWHTNGPNGPMGSLLADPIAAATVYTSGAQGIYESKDGGETWDALRIAGNPAAPIAAGPAETLYAEEVVFDFPGSVVYTSTVYKTSDGGATWNALFQGLWTTYSLVIDPRTPTTLYRNSVIFSGDFHFPSYRGAVDRSVDGGLTWIAVDAGLELGSSVIVEVTLDPRSPDTVYLATQSGGAGAGGTSVEPAAYKSIDSGAHWSKIENAPPGVSTILVLPEAIIVGSVGGVFRSVDRGETFTLINSVLSGRDRPLAMLVDPLDSDRLFATALGLGVQESLDEGATWTPINEGLSAGGLYPSALAISADGAALYSTNEDPGVWVYPIRQKRDPIEPPREESRNPRIVSRRPAPTED